MARPEVLNNNSKEYKNLVAVASMLEATSVNNCRYYVANIYFDYGQDWMWSTIVRDGDCQILSPREWEEVISSSSLADLCKCCEDLKKDRFWRDK